MHEGLYDLEFETKLPVRVAFAGLWTQADREGRFRWRPRQLKAQILPYDECEFSRVLDALATRGFIVQYHVGDASYGWIPGFKIHQIVNNREQLSAIPEPPPNHEDRRVPHACPTPLKGKGKEGKGKEGKGDDASATRPLPPTPITQDFSADPEENIPDGLAPMQYAAFVFGQLGVPAGNGLKLKLGDAIGILAGEDDCTPGQATKRMLDRMREAQRDGPVKWAFWLEERRWAPQSQGVSTEGWEEN